MKRRNRKGKETRRGIIKVRMSDNEHLERHRTERSNAISVQRIRSFSQWNLNGKRRTRPVKAEEETEEKEPGAKVKRKRGWIKKRSERLLAKLQDKYAQPLKASQKDKRDWERIKNKPSANGRDQ